MGEFRENGGKTGSDNLRNEAFRISVRKAVFGFVFAMLRIELLGTGRI